MKEYLKTHKLLISVFFSVLILLGIITYLYYTNSLVYLYNMEWNLFFDSLTKFEKWILSGSFIAVITLTISLNLFSSFLDGLIFPNHTKKILNKTEGIYNNQNESMEMITETSKKIDKLIEKSSIDPRDIEKYLKELPIERGEEETELKINEWYNIGKISSYGKELISVVISVIFKNNKDLSQEINNLKLQKKTEIVKSLENIQANVIVGNANKIKKAYFSGKEKFKQENIVILKESIKATESLCAIKEINDLYKELISLEPSANNYLKFAAFSQKYSYYNDAINYYQEALKIYNKLSKENMRAYLPFIALTLNDLAMAHAAENDFLHALEKYEEALKIRRELAKENPIMFLPEVASTLNNLAVLQKNKNEFPQALEKIEEALRIYRQLTKENPKNYLADIALALNNLANLQKDTKKIQEAQANFEKALQIYRDLTKENPETYLPFVANVLRNLTLLYAVKNELSQALEKYEEAIRIYKELTTKNPRIYEIDYALMLVMSTDLFGKDKNRLEEAKEILMKYPNVYKGQILLERIKKIE